jgi:methionyl-tRNA synthetase
MTRYHCLRGDEAMAADVQDADTEIDMAAHCNLAERFGPDAFRYHLMRVGNANPDDGQRLVDLYNTELACEYGNFCNRSLTMNQQFNAGIITRGGPFTEDDLALQSSLADATDAYRTAMEASRVNDAITAVMRHVVRCNHYAERMKPWELHKDPTKKDRLATVLQHLVENVAHCAVLLSPVIPDAASEVMKQLNRPWLAEISLSELHWGLLPEGHRIGNPHPVFPKIVIERDPGA